MRTLVQHVSILLARVMLSLLFLWNGASILMDWPGHRDALARLGVQYAVPLLAFEVFCLLLGGLLLVVGFRGRFGAVLLILFLVPDAILQGDWSWLSAFSLPGLQAHADEVTHFLKNVGLLGGLLMVLGFGSGGFSVDLFLGRKRDKKKADG
jgi:putative oxidoreductase